MDGFTYYNLFETKGIEYLIIIAFLLLIIPFWIIINRPVKIARQLKRSMGSLSSGILRVPQGMFYGKNHTWAHLEVSGNARVGFDDLLLHITGEVNLKDLKNKGDIVNKGEVLTEVDQNGKTLRITSPISGEIVSTNRLIIDDPWLMNEDPYGKGWVFRIKPTKWVAETNSCHFAEEANGWLRKELERFKDFLAVSMKTHSSESNMVYLQDGGELVDNVLAAMPKEVWDEFQTSFLE